MIMSMECSLLVFDSDEQILPKKSIVSVPEHGTICVIY